jgi:hypothetical protein
MASEGRRAGSAGWKAFFNGRISLSLRKTGPAGPAQALGARRRRAWPARACAAGRHGFAGRRERVGRISQWDLSSQKKESTTRERARRERARHGQREPDLHDGATSVPRPHAPGSFVRRPAAARALPVSPRHRCRRKGRSPHPRPSSTCRPPVAALRAAPRLRPCAARAGGNGHSQGHCFRTGTRSQARSASTTSAGQRTAGEAATVAGPPYLCGAGRQLLDVRPSNALQARDEARCMGT